MKAAIFTLDTGLYRARKESTAASALKRMLEQVGFEVKAAGVLPEDKKVLSAVMQRLADTEAVDLILTTGGVGIQKRDCAPDVVEEISDRLLPGIPEAVRAYNIRHTKKAILDRSAAGIRNHTLLVNLPESAKAAKESLEYILPELVYVVEKVSA
ncbi:MogA/MoaB family molybdenum cofactor biosynthesis protein [Faecalicatena contorta]|uniref:Molybdenum cofactor synthesis domain-containing protein n=1 Tax=Faecalicatena contorta TaxID=39482 RepID=A0A316APH1_9FIRM|nr:MogA/MoaB family molybdenum cofactor biosynthesis protein [Faecalicatena contorta]PWJ51977.1 molybdenum cofactor synthesis domain-containing protein [Faecalicatena contorta]SUQ12255.1 molybdenum cofactor synthesis domain-containing protein [Faecalicatena contorta]